MTLAPQFFKMRQKSKFLCDISKFSNESSFLKNKTKQKTCAGPVGHSED